MCILLNFLRLNSRACHAIKYILWTFLKGAYKYTNSAFRYRIHNEVTKITINGVYFASTYMYALEVHVYKLTSNLHGGLTIFYKYMLL